MSPEELCRSYLDALNEGNLDAVLDLFTKDAQIVSPLYGESSAKVFYKALFDDTNQSDTTLLNIFDNSKTGSSIGLHFKYLWTLASGKKVSFECVDVIEIDQEKQKFSKLTIVYDTAPLREDFEQNQKR